ncbi:hypothetical protein [Spirillospora sp. CA-294931]|uniref:hypothetical protein n=1 Tax=Spirillospora sp. CA-294931 TaxID=3240042 RepID=UPI003D8A0C0E
MIPRISRRVAATVTVLAIGGAGLVAAQAPASASPFTATYSCNVAGEGRPSKIEGSLTASPNPAASGTKVNFALDVASISVPAPVAIESWNATAVIEGSGAESSTFNATASGGSIPANHPIPDVHMVGSWTPSASGTDRFMIGDITINLNVEGQGTFTVPCTPTGTRPVAETLTVN